MGMVFDQKMQLGATVLRHLAGPKEIASRSGARPLVQMDSNPISLLEGSQPLRRGQVHCGLSISHASGSSAKRENYVEKYRYSSHIGVCIDDRVFFNFVAIDALVRFE